MGVSGVLADIATVVQLSGLHAATLIALAADLLRLPQCKAECANLDECARRLHALLELDMATQHPAVAGLVAGALAEAASLVGSYRGSTLWCRVRTGRSMETQLRDTQSRLNCLCVLVLCVHANLLTASDAANSDTSNHHVSHGAETSDASDGQGHDTISRQGAADVQPDNNGPQGGGSESV